MVTADELPPELPPQVTGVKNSSPFASCAELALSLDPDTSHIFCVGDTVSAGISATEAIGNFNHCPEIFDFVYLNHLPMLQLLDRVAHLPGHSSILFVNSSQKAACHSYRPTRLCELIAARSNAPVYAISGRFLGCGVVGVSDVNFEADAQRAARMGLALLEGKRIEDLPVETGVANRLIVDARQTAKRGIPESKLPQKVIRRYREAGAMKWIGAVAFAGACCLLARSRLNRSQASSAKAHDHSDLLIHRIARRSIQVEDENRRLKQLVADLSFDR
jgi:hypothetical protein